MKWVALWVAKVVVVAAFMHWRRHRKARAESQLDAAEASAPTPAAAALLHRTRDA